MTGRATPTLRRSRVAGHDDGAATDRIRFTAECQLHGKELVHAKVADGSDASAANLKWIVTLLTDSLNLRRLFWSRQIRELCDRVTSAPGE